jgi:hypothetical protein
MAQRPLLLTTTTTGSPWRTAVSSSKAWKPKAPSPATTTTGRSGWAT